MLAPLRPLGISSIALALPVSSRGIEGRSGFKGSIGGGKLSWSLIGILDASCGVVTIDALRGRFAVEGGGLSG